MMSAGLHSSPQGTAPTSPALVAPASARSTSGVDEGNEPLLRRTQAYLRLRLQHLAPNALLTQAWERFYAIYTEVIRRYALACHVAPAKISDLIQEVWTQVNQKLPEFHWNENRPGLRAWFHTLVRNKCVDLIRQKGRHGQATTPTRCHLSI